MQVVIPTAQLKLAAVALLLVDLADAALDYVFCYVLMDDEDTFGWGIFLAVATSLALLTLFYAKYDSYCERQYDRTAAWKWGKIYLFETIAFCFEDSALIMVIGNNPELYDGSLGTQLNLYASMVSASICVVFMIVVNAASICCKPKPIDDPGALEATSSSLQQQQQAAPSRTAAAAHILQAGMTGNVDEIENIRMAHARGYAIPISTISGQFYVSQLYFTVVLAIFLARQEGFSNPVRRLGYFLYSLGLYFSFARLRGLYITRNDPDRNFYKLIYPSPNSSTTTTP